MKEAHINCVSVAIFAWAKLEPEEGRYEFDWLEKVIDNLYENGIYTVLATPSGAKPVWMSEQHPEIRRVQRQPGAGMRPAAATTATPPRLPGEGEAMDTALAQRFSKHPGVILWHLSNEYGGECYCPQCQAAFRRWLRGEVRHPGQPEPRSGGTTFWSHTVHRLGTDPRPSAPRGQRPLGLTLIGSGSSPTRSWTL